MILKKSAILQYGIDCFVMLSGALPHPRAGGVIPQKGYDLLPGTYFLPKLAKNLLVAVNSYDVGAPKHT